MNCGKNLLSSLPSRKEESYLQIDLTNPENIFDFSARPISKPVSAAPESSLCLQIVKPPQKLSDLTAKSNDIQIFDRKDGKNKKRRFLCDQCGKLFFFSAHLKQHKLVHTGERPYCCRVCNKQFQRSDYVLIHLKHHKRELVHNCCVCNMTYYNWNEFVTHCLSHDISEYQNITEKTSTTKTLLVEKQSNKCCTAKQDDPNNSLQNVTEPQTFSSDDSLYQATITSPVYSSNCRPLSATMNYLSYNTTVSPPRPRDQYLAQSSFPHQQTFTLYHQKHQPLQQSSSHYYNN